MNNFKEDALKAIASMSDRVNAADLIEPKIITINKISFFDDTQQKDKETKVTRKKTKIHFIGDDGKPYVPCLILNDLIFQQWGLPENPDSFNGRQIEIFNDPTVKLGTEVKGGIRISGMSHIDKEINAKLKRGRASITVYIKVLEKTVPEKIINAIKEMQQSIESMVDISEITAMLESIKYQHVKSKYPELIIDIDEKLQTKQNEINGVN